MDVTTALKTRKSVRAFETRPLEQTIIYEILDAARHAPSGVNMQPWEVAVVSGDAKVRIDKALESAFREGINPSMAYDYYPKVWEEPFKSRRRACGLLMYEALGIGREERERQVEQWAANFRAFDAPTVLFLFIDASLTTGAFIDCGIFLQSVMLAATERGVSICPQAALAEYGDIVKAQLGIDENKIVIAGVAMGFEAKEAPVNAYRTPREPVEKFATFYS
jgi:nitroreductase